MTPLVPGPRPALDPSQTPSLPFGLELKELARRVSVYFLDFLETDFRRQQAPRWKIQLTSDTGFRTGIPLRKYPPLADAIWRLIAEPVNSGLTFKIPQRYYQSHINPILQTIIRHHIARLDPLTLDRVRAATIEHATRTRGTAAKNPEDWVEGVQVTFASQIDQQIIAPILALLDAPFKQYAYSAIESVFQIETDLIEAISPPRGLPASVGLGQLPH